jgi:hypothetical protein
MSDPEPRNRERVEKENRLFGTLLILAGLTTICIPGLMIGSQALTWLRYGYWPSLPIGEALVQWGSDYPRTDWIGVQQFIDWMMSWPASFVVFLGLAFVTYLISIPTSRVQAEMIQFHNQDRYKDTLRNDRS